MGDVALTLGERQRLFARLVPRLLDHIHEQHYACALNWCYRPLEAAAQYASQGKGIKDSLHCVKLAIDVDLFKDGTYLSRSEDHEPFGTYWETLHELCSWGGHFGDGNHYSVTYNGRR